MPPQKGWPSLLGLFVFSRFALPAMVRLAQARIRFSRLSVREIQALNHKGDTPAPDLSASQAHDLAWIAYTVPRLARVAPFRSDCLVQALAAQAWLQQLDMESRIVIGVERPENGEFGAHAWLVCAGKTVTGGETDRYTVLLE